MEIALSLGSLHHPSTLHQGQEVENVMSANGEYITQNVECCNLSYLISSPQGTFRAQKIFVKQKSSFLYVAKFNALVKNI